MNAVAIANNDVAILAWVGGQKIPDCLGFAIYRTDLSSGTTVPLPAWVGFRGDTNAGWEPRTTEVWPVQKFHWKDLTAKRGGLYQYRILPMVGTPGNCKPAPAPVWETNPVHLTPDRGEAFTFFNRGILSTQSLARQLPAGRRYGVVAGTGRFLDALARFRFGPDELDFLRGSGADSALRRAGVAVLVAR